MLFQRSFVLLIGQCKVCDGISKIVFIDACQCLPKPCIAVQEKCWCGADIKLHHQSLHTATLSAHMTVTCHRLKLNPASQHSAQAEYALSAKPLQASSTYPCVICLITHDIQEYGILKLLSQALKFSSKHLTRTAALCLAHHYNQPAWILLNHILKLLRRV